MAYINQEKKRKIATQLKAVMPKDWKYSLAVRNHSTIVCTIYSSPVPLLDIACENIGINNGFANYSKQRSYCDVNHYHLDHHFEGAVLQTFQAIVKALNTDNHDNSDAMTDYFDVGHYVDINLGRWDKPFVFTGAKEVAA